MKLKRVTWLRFTVGMMVFIPLMSLLIALQVGWLKNYQVTSSSMKPTLMIGDRVIMDSVGKDYQPERGEVIIFISPDRQDELLAKRVIGISGDVIQIKDGFLFLNGEEQVEMYRSMENAKINVEDTTVTVEPGEIFVLGDNRNFSFDSLNFGGVAMWRIQGKLKMIYWPAHRMGGIH